jgi:hypothetical protein
LDALVFVFHAAHRIYNFHVDIVSRRFYIQFIN